MQKIIDGIEYRGQTLPDTWNVRVWERNGHRETSARRAVSWEEVGPCKEPLSWEEFIAEAWSEEERKSRQVQHETYLAEKLEKNRHRSSNRAKTMCRRVIKTSGFNELLTITYRANQTDVEVFKKHFKEWVRRMKKALGGRFEYCSGFEPQERGAWHAHVACHKLPQHVDLKGVKIAAWRLGTEVWRSIVGADNGLVFVGGKDRFGRPMRSRLTPAKMAAYVSKYITKHAALFPAEKNRYSRSDAIEPGKPLTMILGGLATPWEVLALAFDARPGEAIVSHRVGRDDSAYWLVTEPEKPPPGRPSASSIFKVPRATAETALQAWSRAQQGGSYVA